MRIRAFDFPCFTGTEPEFWLNLQQAQDLWEAIHSGHAADREQITPFVNWYRD